MDKLMFLKIFYIFFIYWYNSYKLKYFYFKIFINNICLIIYCLSIDIILIILF